MAAAPPRDLDTLIDQLDASFAKQQQPAPSAPANLDTLIDQLDAKFQQPQQPQGAPPAPAPQQQPGGVPVLPPATGYQPQQLPNAPIPPPPPGVAAPAAPPAGPPQVRTAAGSSPTPMFPMIPDITGPARPGSAMAQAGKAVPPIAPVSFQPTQGEQQLVQADQIWAKRPGFAQAKGFKAAPGGPIGAMRTAQQFALAKAGGSLESMRNELASAQGTFEDDTKALNTAVAAANAGQLDARGQQILKKQIAAHDANRDAINARVAAINGLQQRYQGMVKAQKGQPLWTGPAGQVAQYPEEEKAPGALKILGDQLAKFFPFGSGAEQTYKATRAAEMTTGFYPPPVPLPPSAKTQDQKAPYIQGKNDLLRLLIGRPGLPASQWDPSQNLFTAPQDDALMGAPFWKALAGGADPSSPTFLAQLPPDAQRQFANLTRWQKQILPNLVQQIRAENIAHDAGHFGLSMLKDMGLSIVADAAGGFVGGKLTRWLAPKVAPLIVQPLERGLFGETQAEVVKRLALSAVPPVAGGIAGGGAATGTAGTLVGLGSGQNPVEALKTGLQSVPIGMAFGGMGALLGYLGDQAAQSLRTNWNPARSPGIVDAAGDRLGQQFGLSDDETAALKVRLTKIGRSPQGAKNGMLQQLSQELKQFAQRGRVTGEVPPPEAPAAPAGAAPTEPTGPTSGARPVAGTLAPRTPSNILSQIERMPPEPPSAAPVVPASTAGPSSADLRQMAPDALAGVKIAHPEMATAVDNHLAWHAARADQMDAAQVPYQHTGEASKQWNSLSTEARKQHDVVAQAATQTRTANPALADRLTDAATQIQDGWRYDFAHDKMDGNDQLAQPEAVPPPQVSPWRMMTPEEQNSLSPPVRKALLTQDFNNSAQVLDPTQPFLWTPPAKNEKKLQETADQWYEAAQQHLAANPPSFAAQQGASAATTAAPAVTPTAQNQAERQASPTALQPTVTPAGTSGTLPIPSETGAGPAGPRTIAETAAEPVSPQAPTTTAEAPSPAPSTSAEPQAAASPLTAGQQREAELKNLGQLGGAGKDIAEGLYDRLWDGVQRGETTEVGQPSTVLQVAKVVRDRGGLKTRDDLKRLAQRTAELKTRFEKGELDSPQFQAALHALVGEFSPQAGAQPEPKKAAAKKAAAGQPAEEQFPVGSRWESGQGWFEVLGRHGADYEVQSSSGARTMATGDTLRGMKPHGTQGSRPVGDRLAESDLHPGLIVDNGARAGAGELIRATKKNKEPGWIVKVVDPGAATNLDAGQEVFVPTDQLLRNGRIGKAKSQAAAKPERRTNTEQRKRVAEMSPEERGHEIERLRAENAEERRLRRTDELTGIGNLLGWNEAPKKAHVAKLDADGLKWANDKLNYEAGSQIIQGIAESLRKAGLAADSYRIGGDEFYVQGDAAGTLDKALQFANAWLNAATISYTDDQGQTHEYTGFGFTHAIAGNAHDADAALQQIKAVKRTQQRGGRPPSVVEVGTGGGTPEAAPQAAVPAAEPRGGGATATEARPALTERDLGQGVAVEDTRDGRTYQLDKLDVGFHRGALVRTWTAEPTDEPGAHITLAEPDILDHFQLARARPAGAEPAATERSNAGGQQAAAVAEPAAAQSAAPQSVEPQAAPAAETKAPQKVSRKPAGPLTAETKPTPSRLKPGVRLRDKGTGAVWEIAGPVTTNPNGYKYVDAKLVSKPSEAERKSQFSSTPIYSPVYADVGETRNFPVNQFTRDMQFVPEQAAAPAASPKKPAAQAPAAAEGAKAVTEQGQKGGAVQSWDATFPRAGDTVDGRTVREGPVPNTSSIDASLDDYTVLPGIREVSMSHFSGAYEKTARTRDLAEQIKQSGEITPLIVAVDKDGPYILEGGHRYDALGILGAKSFPALVVLDNGSLGAAQQAPQEQQRSGEKPTPQQARQAWRDLRSKKNKDAFRRFHKQARAAEQREAERQARFEQIGQKGGAEYVRRKTLPAGVPPGPGALAVAGEGGGSNLPVLAQNPEEGASAVYSIYKAAYGEPKVPEPSLPAKFLTKLYHAATRDFMLLPKGAEYGPELEWLRRFKKSRAIASMQAQLKMYDSVRAITKDPEKRDLFNYGLVVRNLAAEVARGHEIMAPLTPQDIAGAVTVLGNSLRAYPDVAEAINKRNQVMERTVGDLLDSHERAFGYRPFEPLEDYFRQRVFEKMDEEMQERGGGTGRLQRRNREWMKKREGSPFLWNTSWVQTESAVMAEMLADTMAYDLIANINERDSITERVMADAKQRGLDNWQEAIPKGWEVYKPDPKSVYARKATAPERAAAQAMAAGLEGNGMQKEDAQPVLLVGPKRLPMVIKTELAQTLNHLSVYDPTDFTKQALGFMRWIQRPYKAWAVFGLQRGPGYVLRKEIGELEVMLVNTGTYKEMGWAIGQVANLGTQDLSRIGLKVGRLHNAPDPLFMRWLELGGWHSLLSSAEFRGFGEAGDKLRILGDWVKDERNIAQKAVDNVWGRLRLTNDLRESTTRAATFKSYVEQMRRNPDGLPDNFGSSKYQEIMAIQDIEERAFKLADEISGPYGSVNVLPSFIADVGLPNLGNEPFFRWRALSWARLIQLARNVPVEVALKRARQLYSIPPIPLGPPGAPVGPGQLTRGIRALGTGPATPAGPPGGISGPPARMGGGGQGGPPVLPPTGGGGQGDWEPPREPWNDPEVAATVAIRTLASLFKMGVHEVIALLERYGVHALTLYLAGRFILRAAWFYNLIWAWNLYHRPAETAELPSYLREQPIIVTGRDKDGNPQYLSRLGAFQEVYDTFGATPLVVPGMWREFANGHKGLGDILVDMIFRKGVGSLLSGGPGLSALEALLGKQLFPDWLNPRDIGDKKQFLAQSLGLGDVYNYLEHNPQKPGTWTTQFLGLKTAMKSEGAWDDTRALVHQYLRAKGKDSGGIAHDPKGIAAYNVKLAMRYGDQNAFDYWMVEYIAAAAAGKKPGSSQSIADGFAASLKRMDPLAALGSEADRKEFLSTLNPEEKHRLAEAYKYYASIATWQVPTIKEPGEMAHQSPLEKIVGPSGPEGRGPEGTEQTRIDQFAEKMKNRIETVIDQQANRNKPMRQADREGARAARVQQREVRERLKVGAGAP